MKEERAHRKLSGILSADAVSCSRLMRQDEAAAIATLKAHKEVMASFILSRDVKMKPLRHLKRPSKKRRMIPSRV